MGPICCISIGSGWEGLMHRSHGIDRYRHTYYSMVCTNGVRHPRAFALVRRILVPDRGKLMIWHTRLQIREILNLHTRSPKVVQVLLWAFHSPISFPPEGRARAVTVSIAVSCSLIPDTSRIPVKFQQLAASFIGACMRD